MKIVLIIIGFAYIAALFPTIAQVYYQRKYLHWKVPKVIHFISVWLLMPWFMLWRIFYYEPKEYIKRRFGK